MCVRLCRSGRRPPPSADRSAARTPWELRWGRDGGKLTGMFGGLDEDPATAVALCRDSHARLLAAVRPLTDSDVRRPSRLPNWTIGHVLTHLARNADGHVRRLDGALRGENLARYPGGTVQRDTDIEHGARRSAADIVADLDAWRSAGSIMPGSKTSPLGGHTRSCAAMTSGPQRQARCVGSRGGNPPCRSRAGLSGDGLAGGIPPLGTARSARLRPGAAATNTGCTRTAVLAGRASTGAAAD